MSTRVRTSEVQRQFAASLREDAKKAAGPTGVVGADKDAELSPYLQGEAAKLRKRPNAHVTVDRLVGLAMRDAMKVWNTYNPPSSPRNHMWLSQGEVKKIDKADRNLGVLTMNAVELVQKMTPTKDAKLIPNITVDSPVPGISISNKGDIFTLRADASVPAGTQFKLMIDGHPVELTRYARGLSAYSMDVGEGYGAEQISASTQADGATSAILRIRKDPPGWLTSDQALAKARDGLIAYTRDHRVHDGDWKDMIGDTWEEAVAHGVLDNIANFATPNEDGDSGVNRQLDNYLFVGRGPMDLYTEVTVRKRDGKLLNAYVEID